MAAGRGRHVGVVEVEYSIAGRGIFEDGDPRREPDDETFVVGIVFDDHWGSIAMMQPHDETIVEPFVRAQERVDMVARSHGFRLAAASRAGHARDHAFVEYVGPGLRVRLVWEGQERVLWVESASEVSAQIISRWYDVEWSLAGQRLPLDTDTSDERIERLAGALDRFLATRET